MKHENHWLNFEMCLINDEKWHKQNQHQKQTHNRNKTQIILILILHRQNTHTHSQNKCAYLINFANNTQFIGAIDLPRNTSVKFRQFLN